MNKGTNATNINDNSGNIGCDTLRAREKVDTCGLLMRGPIKSADRTKAVQIDNELCVTGKTTIKNDLFVEGKIVSNSTNTFNCYLFGDSFSTTGNNIHIYGTDPPWRPNGRYSDNGIVNTDYLAAIYGLQEYDAYNPNFVDFASPKGNLLNFAVGGWTTEEYLNGDNGFLGEVPQFLNFMATTKSTFDPKNDVVMFSTCNANDVLIAVTYDSMTDTWYFDPMLISTMIPNLKSIITQLYNFGVRHLILLDASSYGNVAPALVFGESDTAAASLRTAGENLHDQIVTDLSAYALVNWPELDLLISDTGSAVEKLLLSGNENGFREPTPSDPTASVPVPTTVASVILPWKASTTDAYYLGFYGSYGLKDQLPNRDTYNAAFWDDLHPSSHFHNLIARKYFVELIGKMGYGPRYSIEGYPGLVDNTSARIANTNRVDVNLDRSDHPFAKYPAIMK